MITGVTGEGHQGARLVSVLRCNTTLCTTWLVLVQMFVLLAHEDRRLVIVVKAGSVDYLAKASLMLLTMWRIRMVSSECPRSVTVSEVLSTDTTSITGFPSLQTVTAAYK